MNTDEIPTAILIHMAITMDFPEILALCDRDEEFNRGVCLNKWFWKSRLVKDYDIRDVPADTTPKEHFSKIYKLEQQAKKEYNNLVILAGRFKNLKPDEKIILPDGSQLSRADVMGLFDLWSQKYNLVRNFEHFRDNGLNLRTILYGDDKKDIVIPLVHSPTMTLTRPIPIVPSTISGGKTSPRVTLLPVKK